MLVKLLKSKIHRARVTETNLNYEGSITIDEEVMKKADILPGEELWILNLNNGTRFTTYAIVGETNSGVICLNGPAARLAEEGDEVSILAYCLFNEEEAKTHKAKIVYVGNKNSLK